MKRKLIEKSNFYCLQVDDFVELLDGQEKLLLKIY